MTNTKDIEQQIAELERELAYRYLATVYGKIWVEVCYDPTNEHIRKFATGLLDDMKKANALLGFKK